MEAGLSSHRGCMGGKETKGVARMMEVGGMEV